MIAVLNERDAVLNKRGARKTSRWVNDALTEYVSGRTRRWSGEALTGRGAEREILAFLDGAGVWMK